MAPYHSVHTLLLGGSEGMVPGKFLTKMVWSGAIWAVPKYFNSNLKINNFKEKSQQENLIAIFLSPTNLDEHVRMKINTFRIYKGGLGGGGGGAEEIFEKSNKMEAFPYYFFFFFLLFGKAPYIPKIMSLLPSPPKIITSAPQLPENK